MCFLAKENRFEVTGTETKFNPYFLSQDKKNSIQQRGQLTPPEKNLVVYIQNHKPIICPSLYVLPGTKTGDTNPAF